MIQKMKEFRTRYQADKVEIKRIEDEIITLQQNKAQRESDIQARDRTLDRLRQDRIQIVARLTTEQSRKAEFESDANSPASESRLRDLEASAADIKANIEVRVA